MRVVFMGSDEVALPLLQLIARRAQSLLVVSGPDKPAGRGQRLQPNAISAWALERSVELWRPARLDDDFTSQLVAWRPDITFVMAYGRLLKAPIIDLPALGTWNLHASLLPHLRGASPIETAIATGEKETGVALMRMVLPLDAGPVGPVDSWRIPGDMTGPQLRDKVAQAAARLVEAHWEALGAGSLSVTPQDDARATYCRILTKDDSWLDPHAPAAQIAARIRAWGQRWGVGFLHRGIRLKVGQAVPLDESSDAPAGTVLRADERLVLATGQGLLEILLLQRPGGKWLPAKDFLRGYPLAPGDLLEGRPHRVLVSHQPFPRGF